MTFADLIDAQQEAITARWLAQVRPLAPRPELPREALLDSLPRFLAELSRALRRLEDPSLPSLLPERSPVAEAHGAQRAALGFTPGAVAREYPLLQEALLQVAQEAGVQVRAPEGLLLARCLGTATAAALCPFSLAPPAGDERHALLAQLQAARTALEAERARLHDLFENAPAIVVTLRGPEHVFERANPLYVRAVAGGRPLVGLPVAQALPEVVAQGFVALLDGVYRSGEPYVGREVPLRLDRRGDGRLEDTWWTFVYQPTRDAAGAVAGVAAFGFEVTEHVRARREAEALAARLEATLAERQQLQAALAHSEARLRETLRATGAGTLDLDVATGVMHFDAQMRALTGLPPEGPLAVDATLDRVHPGDRPAVEALFQRTLEEGIPFVTEHRLAPRTQGEPERWISTRGAALFGPEGRAVRFLGTAVDITEPKRAEAARWESEAQLHSVLDAIPALVAFIDPAHRYRFGNAAYGRWFGVDPKSLPGRPIQDVIGAESYARVRPYVERALAGEEVRYESPFVFGGGREGVLQAVYVPQRALDGRVVGYVAIAWDVSSERRAEAELRQRADFERQLIGIVSHDLRNPLQVIQLSAATLLRRPGVDDRQAAIIGRISGTAERMTRMIRDLLDFTRARMGGGLALERSPLDLHALTRQVVDEVQLAHPGRAVQVHAEGDAQGDWDADRLAQLLGNLLHNALTYGAPHSPVRVTAHGLNGEVLLEVHNAGAPIPPEQLERLFRPFERGEHAATGAGRSIGLGLFIVDAIVRAHAGRIEVHSTQAEGTTFRVHLPRSAP